MLWLYINSYSFVDNFYVIHCYHIERNIILYFETVLVEHRYLHDLKYQVWSLWQCSVCQNMWEILALNVNSFRSRWPAFHNFEDITLNDLRCQYWSSTRISNYYEGSKSNVVIQSLHKASFKPLFWLMYHGVFYRCCLLPLSQPYGYILFSVLSWSTVWPMQITS